MDIDVKRKLRVLHLEDNYHDRQLTKRLLESDGFVCDVRYAQDREELLAGLEDGTYDIVLADQALPGFDGLSALRIVKERRPELPFIFLTGSMGEELAIETIKQGATDYLL